MILVALAIVASTAVGVAAERRCGERAQRCVAARRSTVLLWTVLPFVTFFIIARLELDAGVGGGLALAYVELAVVGAARLRWSARACCACARHADRRARSSSSILANTGYLGIPLCAALLGTRRARPGDRVRHRRLRADVLRRRRSRSARRSARRRARRARERLRAFLRNPPLRRGRRRPARARRARARRAGRHRRGARRSRSLPVGFFILGVNLADRGRGGRARVPAAVHAPVARRARAARCSSRPRSCSGCAALIVDVPDAYLVQAAMPSGINSLVVAHAYGLDLKLTASAVAWTTAIVVVGALALSPFV